MQDVQVLVHGVKMRMQLSSERVEEYRARGLIVEEKATVPNKGVPAEKPRKPRNKKAAGAVK
ncbi:hypothetical protein [Winkia sp. UMB0889B]|uniref:hypothetical protein n=1 Tax=Winkia sp. UMB0889B TaxID=3046315 RepID=UPI0025538FFF|nr:hypothetical protein [Winkia sp. UMB0889B]MDK7904861.1 hypothetical protein [Winkia sp. UMB0889B]